MHLVRHMKKDGKSLDYIEHIRSGPRQSFSTRFVETGLQEGWMAIGKEFIVLDFKPEKLVYKIERGPGYYCVHCWQKLSSEHDSRAHVITNHKGVRSPDVECPAGYCRINAYVSVKQSSAAAKEATSWLSRMFGGG